MRILFLLPVPSQVRFQRRIRALRKLGCDARVLSFERDYYEGEPLPTGYLSLGRIAHGSYVRRLPSLTRALRTVERSVHDVDVVYAFGLDMSVLGLLARGPRRPPVVYEVGDVRDAMVAPTASSRVLRRFEAGVIDRVAKVVTTSHAYVENYFARWLGADLNKIHVIENKLDPEDMPPTPRPFSPLRRGPITIGYFGLLRCEASARLLIGAARASDGELRVLARGLPMLDPNLLREFSDSSSIELGTTYRSPSDLPAMYSAVDAVWLGYSGPADRDNWRWARSNRFYEAAFYGKPMIGTRETEDAREILRLNLGPCVNLDRPAESIAQLREMNRNDLSTWRDNVVGLPRSTYEFTGEHQRLLAALRVGERRDS